MGHGLAGIDNALFYHEKTRMLFGDARQSLTQDGQVLKTAQHRKTAPTRR